MPTSTGAGLTVAIALVAGMLAQSLASRINAPGIVILLLVGALLGPEAFGWVRPDTLGPALPTLVGFAVSVVLFEGGMNLDLAKLRRESRTIQLLISVGALVTIIGATLTARWVLNWDWRAAALFGTLVVVTGPTVVTPLLRRIHIDSRVATVLEAEAVFGDATGAVIASIAYEFAMLPVDPQNVTSAALQVLARLSAGGLLGALGGGALVLLLRSERVIERGLENVFALVFVLALYQATNSLLHESGIAACIAAGVVVGNLKTRVSRELHAFKGALTVMFIGLLFVLLAADVEWKALFDLGWPGLLAVALLMFVVRPSAVWLSTWRSGMPLNHRVFIAWLAPRGIIAASVASLFAVGLNDMEMAGAASLREMVFLVITVTVCSAGFSGGWVAKLLRLKRRSSGWVILGAGAIARALAHKMMSSGQDVVCIDTNPAATRVAEEAGLKVIYGNGLEEVTLKRAEAHARQGFLALTANEEVNLLFSERIRQYNKQAPIFIALDTLNEGVTRQMVQAVGGTVLFGNAFRAARWEHLFERNAVEFASFVSEVGGELGGPDEAPNSLPAPSQMGARDLLLPLMVERGSQFLPFGDPEALRYGDRLLLAINRERSAEALEHLRKRGWRRLDPATSPKTLKQDLEQQKAPNAE